MRSVDMSCPEAIHKLTSDVPAQSPSRKRRESGGNEHAKLLEKFEVLTNAVAKMHKAIETNSSTQSPNSSTARSSTTSNLSPIQETALGDRAANGAAEIRTAEQGREEEKGNDTKVNRHQRLERKTQRQRKKHNPEGNDAVFMKTL